jgi:head-tail adaptor
MVLPKFKWTEVNPGLSNDWSKMWNKVRIQRPKGIIDGAGGTPLKGDELWEDVIVGHDGNGVYAEIMMPTPEDAILAYQQSVRITHKIRMRYDGRILPGMRAVWYVDGRYHKARIHAVTDIDYEHHWMFIDAVEQTANERSEYL